MKHTLLCEGGLVPHREEEERKKSLFFINLCPSHMTQVSDHENKKPGGRFPNFEQKIQSLEIVSAFKKSIKGLSLVVCAGR